MMLQISVFAVLVAYLTLLAVAFHKLVFEIDENFFKKLAWSALLILIPLLGVVLFYSSKHELRGHGILEKETSLPMRLLLSFVYTVAIIGIILFVIWIANRK